MSSYDFINPDEPSSTSTETESPLQAPIHGPPFEEPKTIKEKKNEILEKHSGNWGQDLYFELEDYPELRYRALCFEVDGGNVEITEIDSDSDKVAEDPSFFKKLKFRLKTLYRNLR